MTSEQDRVHQIMQDMAEGNDVGNKLIYDDQTKTIRSTSRGKDPDKTMDVTPSDMEHFGTWKGRVQ